MYELIFESYPTELLKKKPYPDSPVYLRYFTIAPEKCRYYGHRHIYQLLFWLCLKCLDPDPALRPCLNWYCKIMKDLLDLIEVAAQ